MAKIQHFDQGDVWRVLAVFKIGTTPTDPSNVTVKTLDPSGNITTFGPVGGGVGGSGIVRDSAGTYHFDVVLDEVGYWFVRFEGTGTAAATEDHQAIVDPSMFVSSGGLASHALVGIPETKDWLQQQNIDTSNDLELVRVINDVSARFIEETGNRELKVIGTNPQVRLLWADHNSPRSVEVGDLTSFTQVRFLDDDWTTVLATVNLADTQAEPLVRRSWEPIRRILFNRNVTPLRDGMRVEVTGNFGFPAVPGNVRQAVLDTVAQVMDRDVEHYTQDLGPDPSASGGANVLVLGAQPTILSLPPTALSVAKLYTDPLVR